MLATTGVEPPDDLDSTGSWPSQSFTGSVESAAERMLNRASTMIHLDGPDLLWDRNVEVTSHASNGTINVGVELPDNTILARGSGRSVVTLRGTSLVNLTGDSNSANFGNGTKIRLDYVVEREFQNVETSVQPVIVALAKYNWYRNKGDGDPMHTQILREELAIAAQSAGMVPDVRDPSTEGAGYVNTMLNHLPAARQG
jgi:hypothetical protein